eukprot:gene3445-34334_t
MPSSLHDPPPSFVDDPTKAHLPTLLPELPCHTSFFVALPFADRGTAQRALGGKASCARFRHPCVDDVYSGELAVRSADAWEWRWTVTGPTKDGTIESEYRRAAPELTARQ